MSSAKRKFSNLGLQRRVRLRVEPEPGSDVGLSDRSSSEAPSEDTVEHSGSEDHSGDGNKLSGSEVELRSDNEEEGGSSSDDGGAPSVDLSQLSFGTLARAQATLSLARKTTSQKGASSEGDDPDSGRGTQPAKGALTKTEGRDRLKRASKHAPVEMSSKKRVSRKRDFIEVPKIQARDPRFMPLGPGALKGHRVDEIVARKAYSFLDDYRQDELNQLRAASKKEKDPTVREKLQKAVMSMESQLKAQKRKDRERELLEEHRKNEKELVKQGKKPFYLKKAEQKKKLLLDQYANMKKGQVDKAIERRRKKLAAKEKKALPMARRTAEDRS